MDSATRSVKWLKQQYSIEQFMKTVRMSGISFSHDEKAILVTSNRSGVSNAYSIPIAVGSARQMTFSADESIRAISYFPQDKRIVYVRDRGGNENRAMCIAEEDGQEVEITKGARLKSGFQGWSPDGRSFYCSTDERTQQYLDVYRVDAQSYEREIVFYNDGGFVPAGISGEGDFLFFVKYEGFSDSNLFLYHLESKILRLITPHSGAVLYLPLYVDSESQLIHYRAIENEDEVVEYTYDWRREETNEFNRRPSSRQVIVSASRKLRATIADEKESSGLVLEDRSNKKVIPLKSLPEGNVSAVAISKSDRWLAFYVNGDRDPTELYAYDLWSHRLSKLTNNVNPAIRREDLVVSEVISVESFDGMMIPCLLWKPHQASPESKVPGLIWVHGGPLGQIRKGYAAAVQFLVNRGYAILGVNHRGSTGYGRAFMNAADGKQGREPLWDCIAAKRYLASLSYVRTGQIGIMGGSFGGYMSLAALTFHPEEFAAGVAICGVSNLVRHLEAQLTDPHTARVYLQKIGDPVKDREMLEAVSPALHARQITKPLMVLHGAKDPRVDKVESDDIVRAVRANGGIVEYLEFDDEAHGFRKRTNAVKAYRAILSFLDKYLMHGPEAGESMLA